MQYVLQPKSPRTEQMQSLDFTVIGTEMHSKWKSHHTIRPNRIRPNVPGPNRTQPDGQTRHRLNLRLAEAAHVAADRGAPPVLPQELAAAPGRAVAPTGYRVTKSNISINCFNMTVVPRAGPHRGLAREELRVAEEGLLPRTKGLRKVARMPFLHDSETSGTFHNSQPARARAIP